MKERVVWSSLTLKAYPKFFRNRPWTLLILGFLTPLYVYGLIESIVRGIKTLADPSAGGFFRIMYVQLAIAAILFGPIWPVPIFNAARYELERARTEPDGSR